MRLPRARATSGECAVSEPVSTGAVTNGVTRVLTPLSSNGSSGDQLVLPFTSVDSLNSGLTRTTPTLTPTTLRNIEETFMAFDRGLVAPPVPHQHQAGFVTPQVSAGAATFVATDQPWQQRRPASATPTPPPSQELSPRAVPQQGHTRGGRRPKDDEEVSPEEEQRRRVRRERNKQAAARCRRRRLDLTNTLQLETEELEDERSNLEREIQQLQAQKEELKFLLDAHRPCCKLGRDKENALKRRVIVKPEPSACRPEELQLRRPDESNQLLRRPDESNQLLRRPDDSNQLLRRPDESNQLLRRPDDSNQLLRRPDESNQLQEHQHLRRPQDDPQRRQENELPQHLAQPLQQKQTEDEFSSPPSKQPRPTTLSVAPFATVNNMHKDVPINTPSQGLGLNFDSLMQGGTGLTPISGTALPPLVMPPGTTPALVTPVVGSQPDGRRSDMLSPGVKELVSL